MVTTGDRVYLGGGFDYVGPQTGYGAGVDGASGVMLANAPMIDGTVYASAPDGAGGWYVAGAFTTVGGVARKNAARIGADGVVAKWNPKPNGAVYSLAVSGANVVLGGAFSQVGKTPVSASRIGEVDGSGRVRGGRLHGVGEQHGPLGPGRRPLPLRRRRLHHDQRLHPLAGGSGERHQRRGRRRLRRQVRAARSTPWPSRPTGRPCTPVASFTSASGPTTQSRVDLAGWSTADGSLTGWAPVADGAVEAVAVDPTSGAVYAGGLFGNINGTPRTRLAGIDGAGAMHRVRRQPERLPDPAHRPGRHSNPVCTPGGLLPDGDRRHPLRRRPVRPVRQHDPARRRGVRAGRRLADRLGPRGLGPGPDPGPSGSNVFVGGELTSLNGLVRKGVAALSLTTGAGTRRSRPTPTTRSSPSALPRRQHAVPGWTLHDRQRADPQAPRLGLDEHRRGHRLPGQHRQRRAHHRLRQRGAVRRWSVHPGQRDRPGPHDQGRPPTGAVNGTFSVTATGRSGPRYGNGQVEAIVPSLDGSKLFVGGPFNVMNGTTITQGIVVLNAATGSIIAQLRGRSRAAPAGRGPGSTG